MIWQTHTTTIPTSPNGIAHRIEGQIKKPLVVIDEDKIQKDQFKNYIHIHVLLSFQKHSLSPASNTYHDLNRIQN